LNRTDKDLILVFGVEVFNTNFDDDEVEDNLLAEIKFAIQDTISRYASDFRSESVSRIYLEDCKNLSECSICSRLVSLPDEPNWIPGFSLGLRFKGKTFCLQCEKFKDAKNE
jgi:hypothetical protein